MPVAQRGTRDRFIERLKGIPSRFSFWKGPDRWSVLACRDTTLQGFGGVTGSHASREFATLRREGILQAMHQKLFQGGSIRRLLVFSAPQQAGSFCALYGGVNFGGAQKEFTRNFGIRGALGSVFEEL